MAVQDLEDKELAEPDLADKELVVLEELVVLVELVELDQEALFS